MENEEREKRIEGLKECCSNMLSLIGEDIEREGLLKTPERVARAILDTTAGYNEDPEAILRKAMFKEDYSQMVIVKDIDFYSLCEHHILPFFGTLLHFTGHTIHHCKTARYFTVVFTRPHTSTVSPSTVNLVFSGI